MFKSGVGIHYNVSNLGLTLAFYTGNLGFKKLFYDANNKQVILATNTKDCTIGLTEAQSIVPSTTCTTFEVENIEQMVQILQQKGVKFKGEIIEIPSMFKLATFFDPDGYKLMLSERIV